MDLTRFIETGKELRLISLRITQHGKLIAKYNWDEDDCRRNIYSASKSFTAAAVGIAQKEGLLSVDERLVDAFPDDLPETVSDNLQKATVRDLLTMCLGQETAALMGTQRPYYKETDWVKLSLSRPFVYEPGTKFVYNNVGPYLAGILVQRRAGCDLLSYLQPRMLDPLGIPRTMWEPDRLGNTMGAVYNPLDPPATIALMGGRLKLGADYVRTAFRLPIYETAGRYQGPACIIHGTGDRVVPYTYGERYHELWKGSEYDELPGFDHGFSQDVYRVAELTALFLAKTLR